MKYLRAEKVKNGWYVKVIEILQLSHEQDVFDYCKQNGLKVDETLLAKQGEMIFAE